MWEGGSPRGVLTGFHVACLSSVSLRQSDLGPFQLSWCHRCQRLRAGMLRSSRIPSLTGRLAFANWHPQLGDEVLCLNLHGGSHQGEAPDP